MKGSCPPVLLTLLLAFGTIGPVRGEALSSGDYRQMITACRRAAEQGFSRRDSARLSKRLAAVRTVIFPDGQRVTVDNRDLARVLLQAARGSKTARAEAGARFRTLDALLKPRPSGKAGDPRAQAAGILAREEFRRAARSTKPPAWWTRTWERITRAFRDFWDRLFGNRLPWGAESGALGRVLRFLLYGLAAVAAAIALRALIVTLRRRLAVTGNSAPTSDISGSDQPQNPLDAARERAAAGDYRAAVRLTYLACLRRLHGAGLLLLEDDKTNWEYQRALREKAPAAHETLLPVTRDFDRIWYGHGPATAADYERAVRAHDALPVAPTELGDGALSGAARS